MEFSMSEEYKQYYKKWLSGLESEIVFWKSYMEEQGGIYFYGYEKTISPNRKFELEDEIPIENFGKDYSFVDVGSGPFSRCGNITNKVRLQALSLDPLANIYKILKEENHINNGIRIEMGFVELLSKYFPENAFDMVHMSNSLDHCFDAVYGIFQLLYICKIGGKVILRHCENEARRENYEGLHQWNLSLHNDENTFIIWRGKKRYNISKIFRKYADIELYPDCVEDEGGWVFNKVVMTKKQNILIPYIDYSNDMLISTYDFMLQLILKKIEEKYRRGLSWTDTICQKLKKIFYEPGEFISKIEGKNISSIDIYGGGILGIALYQLLKKCDIQVGQLIDRNTILHDGRETICFEKYIPYSNMSMIVITVRNGRESIKELLQTKIESHKIMYIDDFLHNFQ